MSNDPQPTPDEPLPPVVSDSGTDAPATAEVGLTRAGALWTSLILGFLVLIVLLIFITQNTESVTLTFLTWRWSLPLGVAILLAAIGGGLLTGLVSAARMYQLRRAAKKNLKVALSR
ncbi:MAG: DUF1049 domain-containing protein [Mycobacterium sp.]|nr:DUF1049 domain-containing protein [Mycobacterium sp.]